MSSSDDPDFRQLRLEFLGHVRSFHVQHSHTTDWRRVCESLGISVNTSASNYHGTFRGQQVISVDASASRNRQDYTGWHEICHHLCMTADQGFRALLEEKHSPDVARELEEDLCHEGAGLLLVPDPVLEASHVRHGYHPAAVFALAERAGSLAACLMRHVLSAGVEMWGLMMRPDGVVEFSCTNTRYTIWKSHTVEEGHAVHQAWHGPVEQRAAIPYHSKKRGMKVTMRAGSDGRRVVALFCRKFPATHNSPQGPLFAIAAPHEAKVG